MATKKLYNSLLSILYNIEKGNLTYFDQKYISEGINFMIGEEDQCINEISRDLLFSMAKLLRKTSLGELNENDMESISKNLDKILETDIKNYKNRKHLFLGWYIFENIINKG